MLPQPNAPPVGNYTADQCQTREKQVHENILSQICMFFMKQLLPPEIRTKASEKDPTTMAQSAEFAAEAQ